MRYSALKGKVIALGVIVVLMVVGLLFALAKLQIVQGEQYRDQSENSITQSMQLSASRGDILDRYGRTLVTNEVSYNIVISRTALLRQADPNALILRLIAVCDECGVEHTDTLPISVENHIVRLTGDENDDDRWYFKKFLEFRGIDTEQTPQEIYDELLKRYDVSRALSYEEQRLVVGVRYELELRTAISMPDYVFAYDVSTQVIAAVNDAGVEATSIQESSKRVYKTQYAAHLLGYIGQMSPEEYQVYKEKGYSMNAYVGKNGAEAAFEEYLHGDDGTQIIYTDSNGKITGIAESEEPVPGQNVSLTIDINLQGAAERALESNINQLRETEDGQYVEGAAAVVVEVGTGDILVSASYPTYDLATFFDDFNLLLENEDAPLLNRAINGLYEPGSTFKPVTAVAALENDIISSGTAIRDDGVYTFYQGYTPTCWIYTKTGGTHGTVAVSEAIRDSCNYFFYEVGRLTGIDLITQYAEEFGLGVPTGLEEEFYEYVGTAAGIEEREANGQIWVAGDTLQAAIGQSDNRFTPLQLANYVATLANGGVRYGTHLLNKVYSSDYSQVTYEHDSDILGVVEMSDDTYQAVTAGMRMVVTEGTAWEAFANSDVSVAAKTGTAQVGQEANNAIFVCYAPYENPEIAVSVVVEKGVSGSTVAVIAAEIVESYFDSKDAMASVVPENELLK